MDEIGIKISKATRRSKSVPNIVYIIEQNEDTPVKKEKRRVSIACEPTRSSSEAAQPQRQSTRRGSELFIGLQRRVSRVSTTHSVATTDGGYGWVVVFCSFSILYVSMGFLAAFAVYYVEFLEVFGQSKSLTSSIGSMLRSMLCVFAPVASACSGVFGFRTVGMVGALMSCSAMFISSFSPNIEIMIISLGLFGGLGVGLLFMVAVMPISYYFDKNQSLAIGIATCGTGFGFMCYPFFSEWLIEVYGWRGSLWISAGLQLNCLVFCALMRPVQDKSNHQPDIEAPCKMFNKGHTSSEILPMDESDHNVRPIAITLKNNISERCLDNIPDYIDQEKFRYLINAHTDGDMLNGLTEFRKRLVLQQHTGIVNPDKGMWDRVLDVLDISFLWNPVFVYYLVLQITSYSGITVGLLFIMDYGISLGASVTLSTALVSMIGVAGIAARIVVGQMTDYPVIDPFIVYGVVALMFACVTVVCTVLKGKAALIFYAISLGIMQGTQSLLSPVLTMDLVGVDHMKSAFSLVLCIIGLASLPVVPIAGWLFDVTQDYTATFLLSASLTGLSGIMGLLLRCLARSLMKKQEAP